MTRIIEIKEYLVNLQEKPSLGGGGG